MKTPSPPRRDSLHSHEDTLLDFAYGELPAAEARAVEEHLTGCTRCTETLDTIRGVRSTMSVLRHEEPAPEAGLDSLLAYAEQAARRAQAGPVPRPTWWRRLLIPVTAAAAFCVVAVIGMQVSMETDLGALADKPMPATRDASPVASAPASSSLPEPAQEAEAKDSLDPVQEEEGARKEKALAGLSEPQPQGIASGNSLDYETGSGGGIGRGSTSGAPKKKSKSVPMEIAGSGSRGKGSLGGTAGGAAFGDSKLETTRRSETRSKADAPKVVAEKKASRDYARAAENDEDSFAEAAAPPPPPAKPSARKDAPQEPETEPVQKLVLNKSNSYGPAPSAPGSTAPYDDSTWEREAASDSVANASTEFNQPARQAPVEDPRVAPLSESAWTAYRQGNRTEEARLLREALTFQSIGTTRSGLLNRLCDAEFALGRVAEAERVCNSILAEFPDSPAAATARKRMSKGATNAGTPSNAGTPKPTAPTTTQH